ncbi:thioredoxin-like protein [Wilcoxina mikolae CBS 423.85]|nr:thioredoxin-like protein [Wilcoxina mikolae CBS 423.85]
MTNSRNSLRIGSKAPNFQAEFSKGPIDLYNYIGDDWVILLAHPKPTFDFWRYNCAPDTCSLTKNPVSSTELAIFQALLPEFNKRKVKLLALIPDTTEARHAWIKEIEAVAGMDFAIPIIVDTDRNIPYNELHCRRDHKHVADVHEHDVPTTVRGVFIIDHKNIVRLVFSYLNVVDISTNEVIRIIDCLQTCDASKVMTPVNWSPGVNVLVNPDHMDEEEAKVRMTYPYNLIIPLY